MYFQADDTGRLVGIRATEPPAEDADIWQQTAHELGDDFADYRLVDGALVHDPLAEPTVPATPQDVVGALFESRPELFDELPDGLAERMAPWFDEWSGDGVEYGAGRLLNRGGTLYRVLQAHASQPGLPPEDAPSLFAAACGWTEVTA